MMAGADGAMRATGWRATAIWFQQFGEGEKSAACSLSDISGWRAGVLYPLAGGGRESGAAHLDLLGPPGRRCGCCRRRGFLLVIFRFGATLELGRSERPTMRPLWSYRVDGADSPDRKPR